MKKCPGDLRELLKTLYNLSHSEVDLFYYICNSKKKRVKEIAQDFNKDRSTIQRLLKTLYAANLVERKSETYPGNKKGRYYVYSIVDRSKLKKELKDRIETWSEKKKQVVDNI